MDAFGGWGLSPRYPAGFERTGEALRHPLRRPLGHVGGDALGVARATHLLSRDIRRAGLKKRKIYLRVQSAPRPCPTNGMSVTVSVMYVSRDRYVSKSSEQDNEAGELEVSRPGNFTAGLS